MHYFCTEAIKYIEAADNNCSVDEKYKCIKKAISSLCAELDRLSLVETADVTVINAWNKVNKFIDEENKKKTNTGKST